MNISYSRVSSYLSCPYKHYLNYEVGVYAKKPARPLMFGTDFHKLLELRNNPEELAKAKQDIGEKFYELKPEWQSELGENYVIDLASIFSDYMEIYKDCPVPKITEQEFQIPIGTVKGEPIIFKGVIDELYKFKDRKTGEKYLKIGEHKTFNQKPNYNTLVMNTQKCLYAKACVELYGRMPKSIIWDYIHSTPAATPIWLEKSQRFSTAKSDKITPFSWKRACEERGITDNKILQQGEEYSGNITNFFFRCEMDIVERMVDSIWDGFVYTCKDIVRQGHKNLTKNITRDCMWCTYHDICYAELTGGDTQEIISRDFVIEPRTDVQSERRIVNGLS